MRPPSPAEAGAGRAGGAASREGVKAAKVSGTFSRLDEAAKVSGTFSRLDGDAEGRRGAGPLAAEKSHAAEAARRRIPCVRAQVLGSASTSSGTMSHLPGGAARARRRSPAVAGATSRRIASRGIDTAPRFTSRRRLGGGAEEDLVEDVSGGAVEGLDLLGGEAEAGGGGGEGKMAKVEEHETPAVRVVAAAAEFGEGGGEVGRPQRLRRGLRGEWAVARDVRFGSGKRAAGLELRTCAALGGGSGSCPTRTRSGVDSLRWTMAQRRSPKTRSTIQSRTTASGLQPGSVRSSGATGGAGGTRPAAAAR